MTEFTPLALGAVTVLCFLVGCLVSWSGLIGYLVASVFADVIPHIPSPPPARWSWLAVPPLLGALVGFVFGIVQMVWS